jgi:hypothetical protein
VTQNVGGALLRILGAAERGKGEPNPASTSDAFDIINAILHSKEFRSRCHALSTLSSEVPIQARKEICRSLLILMTSKWDPLEEPPMKNGKPDFDVFRNTTQEYCSLAAPRPNTKWSAHIEAKYKKSAAPEWVRVSPYLAEIISAFEALFGIRGSLLAK